MDPTIDPTRDPTADPTIDPTSDPTTRHPTSDPTQDPTKDPTSDPTIDPTVDPTADPTTDPTKDPTTDPTVDPTLYPTRDPTTDPTKDPTTDPTIDPTNNPSQVPTAAPTQNPTTPAPTHPGDLTCGQTVKVVYNSHPVYVEVEMNEFDGDLTFDASDTDFTITNITARDGQVMAGSLLAFDRNGDDIVTLVDVPHMKFINFTVEGNSNDKGTFNVTIICTSDSPTKSPTKDPTADPTIDPTRDPTSDPTKDPSADPTRDPTRDPTANPTQIPTHSPSRDPTRDPTISPSGHPTIDPTSDPTKDPTTDPTQDTTRYSTATPTKAPSNMPTNTPSNGPTTLPSHDPSTFPSQAPSGNPTTPPSLNPTSTPFNSTDSPTNFPFYDPTEIPSTDPSSSPTSTAPSNAPTYDPTKSPSSVTTACDAWSIEIQFTLLQYATSMDEISTELFGLCLRAFNMTIFNAWDDKWCVTLSFKFSVLANSRRRNLLQTNDIECEAIFEFNDILYEDYFSSGYNETKFASDYTTNIESLLNSTSTVSDVQVGQPVQLIVIQESNDNTFNDLNIQIIILLLIVAVVWILIASIYSKLISINDFYRIGALVTVTVHINDTVSDALFCANVPLHSEYPGNNLFLIFNLSIVFLALPAVITLYQLHSGIKRWKGNDELSQWLSNNIKLLYFVSVITGNSFVGIELCTSNLFNLSWFDMPLSRHQLLQFQTNSIFSIILFEV